MAPTSGTVATTPYNQAKVIEHALRRAGFRPEKVGAESIIVAQETLFSMLSEFVNAQMPLWTRQLLLLPIVTGSPDVVTPVGTVEVMHSYWVAMQPYRGACTLTGGATDLTLFGGAPNADVAVPGPNPSVTVNFLSATELDMIGVLPGAGAPYTAALGVYTSPDGSTWTLAATLPSTAFATGQWSYFELDPTLSAQFVQLQFTGASSWTLNQVQFGLANSTSIELGLENIDSYYNLPNRNFKGDLPNTVYQDRQLNSPVLKIWPSPSVGAFYNGTISALCRRYIQDPGALTNNIEVPPRWLEAVQWRLAHKLIFEIPEEAAAPGQSNFLTLAARTQRIKDLDTAAIKAEALVWGEERNRSPIRIAPSIRPYTL